MKRESKRRLGQALFSPCSFRRWELILETGDAPSIHAPYQPLMRQIENKEYK